MSRLLPKDEAMLRGVQYDCGNIRKLLEEIDFLRDELRKADFKRWQEIKKNNLTLDGSHGIMNKEIKGGKKEKKAE